MTEDSRDPTVLTMEQKRQFYRDGFVVLRNVVSRQLTRAAKRRVNMYAFRRGSAQEQRRDLGDASELSALVNESVLGDILRNTMGAYDPPQRGFAAILPPRDPSSNIGIHGLPDDQLPNFGFNPHLDGLWTGPLPQSHSEVDSWQAPRTEHFGDGTANVRGSNMTPLFQNPERTLAIGSFTAFVGVALSDQTEFGYGNLALLRGAHHEVERFFQMQRDRGGPIGPEGPSWPRLVAMNDDKVGLNYLPHSIRDKFAEGAKYTPDGTMWPQPAPILMDEGDAVIVLHSVPHCGTRNELGFEPRMNIYFRLRHERPGGAVVLGDSDHPDRGWTGEFLGYAEDYDPWQVAIDALCDHWSEWEGMADVVADEHSKL